MEQIGKEEIREVDPADIDEISQKNLLNPGVDLPKPAHYASRLSLERALWPLRRRTPLQAGNVLDELVTSETTADLWRYDLTVWQPEFLKTRTRWYDLVLLIDNAPSMNIWAQEVAEFSDLLVKQKFVRRFTRYFVNANSAGEVEIFSSPKNTEKNNKTAFFKGNNIRHGQTLILIISDCVGEAWHDRRMSSFLEEKMSAAQVVLMQVLPQKLWYLSAAHNAGYCYVAPRERCEPNNRMLTHPPEYQEFYDGYLPLPVILFKESSILAWAKSASGLRGQTLPAFYFESDPQQDLSIEQRLNEFYKRASDEAVQFARLMTIVFRDDQVFDLQTTRSMAQVLELRWGNDVLAEFLLSQLIEMDDSDPTHILFKFHPGIAEPLSSGLTFTEIRHALNLLLQKQGKYEIAIREAIGLALLESEESSFSRPLGNRIFQRFNVRSSELIDLAKQIVESNEKAPLPGRENKEGTFSENKLVDISAKEISNLDDDLIQAAWNERIKLKLLNELEKSAIEASDQGQAAMVGRYLKAREMVKGISADRLPVDFISNLEVLVGKDLLRSNVSELYEDPAPALVMTNPEENSLMRLRRYQQARPQIAAELAAWEEQLRKLANSVQQEQGASPEADAALNLALTSRNLNKHYNTIKQNQDNLQAAVASLDLGEINNIITSARGVLGQLEADKDFAEFALILSELLETAKKFIEEADKAKDKVSGELSVNVTLRQTGEYDQALDHLYEKQESGILQVLNAEGKLVNVMEAIGQTRRDLIEYLKGKIKERITKANADLGRQSDSGLIDAATELDYAQKLCANRRVGEDLKSEELVSKDLHALEGKVGHLLAARAEADNLLKAAHGLDEVEAIEKINALQYKWLDDVDILKKELQNKLLSKKNNLLDQQIRTSVRLCRERKLGEIENYGKALDLLEEERGQLVEILADVVDAAELLEKLDTQIDAVTTERDAWQKFYLFRQRVNELSKANQVQQGLLDQVTPADRTYWQEHFRSEYGAIESEVIKQGGAKTIFDRAWSCYQHDPADVQIKSLLVDEKGQETISLKALQHKQASALLNMHYAYTAWQDAKGILQNTEELIKKHRDWHNNVQKKIRVSQNFCAMLPAAGVDEVLSPEEQKLKQDADTLTRDLEKLLQKETEIYNNWDRSNTQLVQREYKSAYLVMVQSKGEEEASPEIRNLYINMQAYIKNAWRDERINDIRAAVIENTQLPLERLRMIAQNIDEMAAFNVLNHDGDGLLISKFYSTWHLREVEDALGFKLDQVQDDNLDVRLNELATLRGLDWGKLLGHLDELLKYPPEGKILRHIGRLRMVALGYYGLTSERKESIPRLDAEIKRLSGMSDAAIVYVTLALRYLEEPAGFNQATELAAELEAIGPRARQVAFGLNEIITAYSYKKNGDLIQAVDFLNSGVSTLKQYIPELSSAVDRNIQKNTYGWYQSTGDSILSRLTRDIRLLERRNEPPAREKFFEIWEKLNKAYRYLPDDGRIQSIVQLLNRFSGTVGIDLLEDVNDLLDNTEETLKHKIELGEAVLNYLDIAFPNEEGHASYRPASEEWIDLEGLRSDLRDNYGQWQEASAALTKARQAFEALLLLPASQNDFDPEVKQVSLDSADVWVWNKNPKSKPLQVIDLTQNSLNKALEEMPGYRPAEFTHFDQFIGQLRQAAAKDILASFQALVQVVREEKYENVKKNLLVEKLRSERDGFEVKLKELWLETFKVPAAIHLDPFYRLEDPMRGDYVVGLNAIEKHLDTLQKNCTAWSGLAHRLTDNVKKLTDRRNEARKYLTGTNGKLSDAVNLCREDIPVMLEQPDYLMKAIFGWL